MTPSSFYRCLNLWINSDLHADMLLHKLPLVEPEAPFGSRRLLFADGSGFDPADHRGGATGSATETRELAISSMFFDAIDLVDDAAFIDLILEVQNVLATPTLSYGLSAATMRSVATPPAFAHGFPFAYWQQVSLYMFYSLHNMTEYCTNLILYINNELLFCSISAWRNFC
jgi:hypothetical protein